MQFLKRTLRRDSLGPATPVAGGCVRVGLAAEPEALLPYASTSATSTDVQSFLFQQWADVGADLVTFAPALAESWRFLHGHRTLEMVLRPGLRWSDGEPVDADDVQFSFEVARDPLVGWQGTAWKSRIEACDVVDTRTVRYRFTEVYPDQLMDANAGFIVPAHRLRAVPRAAWRAAPEVRLPVGTGPFRLQEWTPGRLVLERNPYFVPADRPWLERVEFVVVADPAEQVATLRDGRIDFLAQVPETAAAELRAAYEHGTSDVRIVTVRGRAYDYVCYNPRHAALGCREVRRALTLAIDREAIIRTFCAGLAEPFEGPIVPVVWAYDPAMPITPYDPRAARALLAAHGWLAGADGVRAREGVRLEFELATNADSERRAGAAHAIAAYWSAVGVRGRVVLEERTTLLSRLDARRYDAALSGWRARLKPDLAPMWGCASVGGKINRVDYCNPEVDALNAAALACEDVEQARVLFARAQRLVAADHPYTWLYYAHDVVGIRAHVRGAVVDARGSFQNPEDWWSESRSGDAGRTGRREH
jgi:peptide/nickel transport system substrate-binding protein